VVFIRFSKAVSSARRIDLDDDPLIVGARRIAFKASRTKPLYEKLRKAEVGMAIGVRVFQNGSKYFFLRDLDGILVECNEPDSSRMSS
jgi:hypothetical protein